MIHQRAYDETRLAYEMYRIYETGKSTRDLVRLFGVNYHNVRKLLIGFGTDMNKSRSLSNKLKGRPSKQMGVKRGQSTIEKMKALDRTGWKTTAGRKYTDEQRQKMKDAFARNRDYRLEILKKAHRISLENKLKRAGVKTRKELSEKQKIVNRQRGKYKALISRMIKATGKRKCVKSEEYVGYSQKEFVAHIEKQFYGDMSWDKRESFHVDHIIPVAHFIRNGITDPKIINALSNLRPLTPDENRKKSDKIEVQ